MSQYPWWRRELEELTRWLDIQDSVDQLWIEPVPDLGQGLAADHDMLDGVKLGAAELTCSTDGRLVVGEQLIAHIITSEEFQV